jgi:hypothetical protein
MKAHRELHEVGADVGEEEAEDPGSHGGANSSCGECRMVPYWNRGGEAVVTGKGKVTAEGAGHLGPVATGDPKSGC